ncbi:response regulator transcription factor [Streptomyces sp. NPDC059009]|uniref:response regulator transcription factor n=1 Tax=Streptomyces sp. NPDC059009 TaxID=3346694 RepID=UPI0036B6917E
MRVLVVEDEEFLADLVAEGLRHDSLAVDVARDGAVALRKLRHGDYDVVVLDRDVPVVGGDEICHRLVAEERRTRVLMLTASGTLDDRVAGLRLGADDYLTKPFAYEELLARVVALGRRAAPAPPPALRLGGLTLDPAARRASRDGRPLALSRKEFAVLEALMRAGGATVRTDDLVGCVWEGDTGDRTNAVRILVSRVRAKLGDPPAVETVPGAGYRILCGPGHP